MALYTACTFSIRDGLARCRKEAGKCDSHRNGDASWEKAPRPTVVLVKVNVNSRWEEAFKNAGIRVDIRSIERAEALEHQRAETAQQLGRSAYAIRADSGRGSNVPEDADTGCPVFGKSGLAELNVSLQRLGVELQEAGFILTRVTLLKRYHKPPTRLVMEFSMAEAGKPAVQDLLTGLINSLVTTTFNQVDVWANEKKPNGQVVHTVNCGKRDDTAKPQYRLAYANGDWDAVPVVEPAA